MPLRKRRFLKRAARSFGRSALLLSGGASLSLFHIGVIEELEAQGLLPRVVTGSSAGSIMAGILATHTDAELEVMLDPEYIDFEWCSVFKPFDLVKGQGVLDQKMLKKFINRNIPGMTFLEANPAIAPEGANRRHPLLRDSSMISGCSSRAPMTQLSTQTKR